MAHREHAVVHGLQREQHGLRRLAVDGLGSGGLAFEVKLHFLFRYGIFLRSLRRQHVEVDAHLLFLGKRHCAHGVALAGNGVVQAATLNVYEAQVGLFKLRHEIAHEQFVGVGAFLVDVVARVSACQPFHADFEAEIAFGHALFFKFEAGRGAHAAGAAHEHLPLVFRVEVDEEVACHKARLQAHCARQARFLVAREEALDGAVLDVARFEDGHLHGHADAVVCAEGSAACLHPVAVHVGLDGVVVEVKLHVGVLLAHHVEMALQHHGLHLLAARRGGLLDEHVAHGIDERFQPEAFAEGFEEVYHLFFPL